MDGGDAQGGGILNDGTAWIEDSFIFLNEAFDIAGGGIFNRGDLNVTRSNFVNNRSAHGGGRANFGRANVDRVFVWLNNSIQELGSPSGGGGIYNGNMELNVVSSTIAENTAEGERSRDF